MSTLAELIQQRDALNVQIAQVQQAELADAVSKAQALVMEFGLSEQDVFGSAKRGGKARSASKNPVAAKYRDQATGQTWTGRGIAPKWIEGRDRAQFVI